MKIAVVTSWFLLLTTILNAQQFQMSSSVPIRGTPSLFLANDSEYIFSYGYSYGFRIDKFSRSGQYVSGKSYQRTNAATPVFSSYKRDSIGNIYALGSSDYLPSTASDHSAVIYKLDSNGILIWSSYAHTSYTRDVFNDILISQSGSIYAAGWGIPPGNYISPMIVKYSPNGQVDFAKVYMAEGQWDPSTQDQIRVFSPNDTDIFILGTMNCRLGGKALFVTKIDTLGNQKWTKFIQGNLTMRNIAIGDTSVYITGYIQQGNTYFLDDVFLVNMGFSGNVNWLKTYGTNTDDEGHVCSIESNGNLRIGGTTHVLNQQYGAIFDLEVDKDGNQVFARYRQIASGDSKLQSIRELDSLGNFAALGVITNSFGMFLHFESDKASGLSSCNETNFLFTEHVSFPLMIPCDVQTTNATTGTPFNLAVTTPPTVFSGITCYSNCNVNTQMIISQRDLCYGDSLSLRASDTTLTFYRWYLNDTLRGTNSTLHLLMNQHGANTIKLVVANSSCADSSMQSIYVKTFPVAQYSLLRHYHLLSLTNISHDADHVHWEFSDGYSSGDNFLKHAFRDTGYIYLQMVAKNICGTDTLDAAIGVNDSTQASYAKFYDVASPIFISHDMTVSIDGGIIVGANDYNNSWSLAKTSITGEPLWAKYTNGSLEMSKIFETSDLGIVCGTEYNGYFKFTKLDSTGNHLWTVNGIGVYQASTIVDIYELPNHEIVATGKFDNANSIYIICINQFGTVKWFMKYTDMWDVRSMLVSDHGIYVFGKTGNDLSIMKVGFNGIEIWIKNYGGTQSDYATEAVFQGPNRILTAGVTRSFGFIYGAGWILCTDTLGNVIWSKAYSQVTNGGGFGQIVGRNNKFYVTGGGAVSGQTYTYYIDSLGTMTGSSVQTWNSYGIPMLRIRTNYESELISLGLGSGGYEYFLSKRNTDSISACYNNGYVLTETIVSPTVVTPPVQFYTGLPSTMVGSPVLYATSFTDTAYCSTYSCTVNSAFTYNYSGGAINFMSNSTGPITSVLWDFGDGNFSSANNPTHYYNAVGQYTVCLYAYSSCTFDTFCQIINVFITSEQENKNQEDYTAWPNPASDILNIDFGNNKIHSVSVIDVSGRCFLFEKDISADKLILDVSILANGLYFLKVENTNGKVSGQKVLISR
ncbi:hypothetical protein BH11BAC7_BH11BAC7_13790 [soil metagenome]